MSKVDELLAVLDMPTVGNQIGWCLKNAGMKGTESLADLAFRLRDEVRYLGNKKDKYFFEARAIVCRKSSATVAGIWFSRDAQPIHWIIAALIAKELAKE